ncbi:recombinase family protein [Heliomarina baculiformis]|uniref:recombinase family protein n=1 Tax=Heliomarina baculiformis TaxID=2872036 RepID=UPI003B585D44
MPENTKNAKLAVIYNRVSSHKQTVEGHGLKSQEVRCREFARMKSYEVVAVFVDDISGGKSERPGMRNMLTYLTQYRKNQVVVIIDDISRLARGLEAHLALRASIKGVGAELESPSIEFGEDSDSILVENLLASVSQHQRQKNSEQTHNRMRGRLLNGYWPFHAPKGYKAERRRGYGKVLMIDEPKASIVREALCGFASGRFRSQAEVTRFLNAAQVFRKGKGVKFKQDHVKALMLNPLYAGYVGRPEWEVPWHRGEHEALITYETHLRIRDKLREQSYAAARKDISSDFPLRGFIICDECGTKLTGYWARSHTLKRYAYYQCRLKSCAYYGKAVPKAKLEEEFEQILKRLVPDSRTIKIFRALFERAWKERAKRSKAEETEIKSAIKQLEHRIDDSLDQLSELENRKVIKAFEKRVSDLQEQQAVLKEKLVEVSPKSTEAFEKVFELAMEFLSSPWKYWQNGSLETKLILIRLTFQAPIAYRRGSGFRTPKTTFPFKVLKVLSADVGQVAARRGIEPLFPG